MLDITVKTLDSQNHQYSVPDDITVKQFKEKIAPDVDIPAARQRLIYCGRVLHDDKALKDYDVHEKAVHLVARPPPQSATQQQQQQQSSSGRSVPFPPHPPIIRHGPSSSTVRLNNAKQYLQRGSTLLEQIDSREESTQAAHAAAPPETDDAPPEAPPPETESGSPPQSEDRQSQGGPPGQPMGDSGAPFSHLAQFAQQAVITAAMSAARSLGNNLMMQFDGNDSAPQMGVMQFDVGVGIERPGSSAQNGESMETSELHASPPPPQPQQPTPPPPQQPTPPPSQPQQPTPPPQQQPQQQETQSPQRPPRPRTSAMVEVLDELIRVTQQLHPYLERCRRYLHEDADFTNNEEEANNAQRLFNRVSETLHLMAHAQHALSDIDVDFHRAPPRHLRSQYVVLSQPTAILQTGVPMQINVTTSTTINRQGQSRSNNNTGSSTQSQATSTTATSTTTTSKATSSSSTTTTTSSGSTSRRSQSEERAGSRNTTSSTTSTSTSTTTSSASRARRDPFVFMSMGPSSITIDNASGPNGGGGGNGNPLMFGGPPPPDFFQNMMSAIAQHYSTAATPNGTIEVRLSTSPPTSQTSTTSQARSTTSSSSTSSTSSSSSSSISSSSSTGNQNSQAQARVNTATNPTMSTQTRSTSRPHVHHHHHPIPTPLPGGPGSSFDIFLPCNSHHVRRPRRHVIRTHTVTRSEPRSSQATQPPASSSEGPSSIPSLLPFLMMHAQRQSSASRSGDPSQMQGDLETAFNSNISLLDLMRMYTDFPEAQHDEGSTLISDLIVLVLENVNARDLTGSFLNPIQDRLRQFVAERIMEGRDPTEANLQQAAELLMSNVSSFLESMQNDTPIREGIDYVSSLRNLMKDRMIQLLRILTSKEPVGGDRFHQTIVDFFSNTLDDFIALCMLCHQDRRDGIRNTLTARLNGVGLDATSRSFATTVIMSRLRSRLNQPPEDRVRRYVIRRARPAQESRPVPVVPAPVAQAAAEPMETDNEDTTWQRMVPAEWIPVITADVRRQRRLPPQTGPYSDAYMAGMPCKKRRISRQPHNTQELLSESLRRALSVSGVTPANGGNVIEEVKQDNVLGAAFREQLKSEVNDRVSNDPDYNPERFPNTHTFIRR